MDAPPKSRLTRRLRAALRWARITALFCLFLVAAAGAYLHLIGLPDFLKRPLLGRLRERGFEAQFSNARLGWGPEVVIDNAAFDCPGQPLVPRFSGERCVARFDLAGLLHRRVKLALLRISQGSLQLPLSAAKGDFLSVNNVSMDLALLPNDAIRLQVAHASFHGMQIDIQGTVTNFMAARDWNPRAAAAPANRPPAANPPPDPYSALRQFAEVLGKIHFLSPPHLSVFLGADGHDPDSLWTSLSLRAGGTQTPWGEATGVRLTASCVHPMNPGPSPFLKVRLTASDLTAPQAKARNMELTANVSRADGTNLTAVVNWAADDCQGRWLAAAPTNDFEAAHLDWNGSATLRPTPLTFVAATGTLRGEQVATRWGSAQSAHVTCAASATEGSPAADASWGLWANFNRWALDWQADVNQVTGPKINFGRIQCAGRWRAPELVLTNLDAALYGGRFAGGIRLDVSSRELGADASLDFDPRQISHLLTPSTQLWMAQLQWDQPPRIAARATLVLPDWTKPGPDWWNEVLPSLQIAGNFSVGPASYRALQVSSAESSFTYSNQAWSLPRLRATRPEGDLLLDYTGSDETGDFLLVADSGMDPKIARPLLPPQRQPLLDEVSFSAPPQIHAEVRGCWGQPGKTAFTARFTATNLTVRGEKIDSLAAAVDFTNLLARFTDGRLVTGAGQLAAECVAADFAAKRISLSNAVSTLDPAAVLRALGTLAPGWLKTLVFDTPPTVKVQGSFAPDDALATDLHFAVSGRNFHHDNLAAGQISGEVHWAARSIAVTNLSAHLYEGSMSGWGLFDYAPKVGTDVRGRISLSKIQLPLLARAFGTKSNHLEGSLDAGVSILGGNSEDLRSWRATGHVFVSQARLWDIKIFGVFSPILNAIVPGSGNTRAYQASADFVVTNAVLNTDNLEIRSTGFRLVYHGTLNTDKQLNARAEALLLRNTPFIGELFRWPFALVGKLFEYKIGGTLNAPTYKPLYMPKILTEILHPFHTLKGFLPPEEPGAPPSAPATAPKNAK